MNENKFANAGWLAVAGAILVLPVLPGGIVLDIMFEKGVFSASLSTMFLLFSVTQAALVIFAFYRFKAFLNEVFEFNKTDFLILAIVGLAIIMTSLGVITRITTWAGASEAVQFTFIALIFSVGIPLGVLSVIFGIKLLELKDSGQVLLKPFAYLHIVAGILFATFILAPVGMLVGAVADLLMGMMMLRKGPEVIPDFV